LGLPVPKEKEILIFNTYTTGVFGRGNLCQAREKNSLKDTEVAETWAGRLEKRGRKSHFSGLWVGAFSVLAHGVYRNPVHILAIFGLKYAKSVVLGVDVIQGLARILQPLKRAS